MRSAGRGLAYCRGRVKRGTDLLLAVVGLLILCPVLLFVAIAVVATSGSPVLFRQERTGMDGRLFRLLKFRTMRTEAGNGLLITAKGDSRVTPVGRLLRASKLDELPQLINVLRGDMSVVGPRPEVPRYVVQYTPAQRRVLEVRPGLTDPATVLFRDEEALLATVEEGHREAYYVTEVLPRKLTLNLGYIDQAGWVYDVVLMMRTLLAVLVRSSA